MRTPEALLEAMCVLCQGFSFLGKRLLLLQSTAGLRPAGSAAGRAAFPPKFLSQSQESPFPERLLLLRQMLVQVLLVFSVNFRKVFWPSE